LTITDNAGKSLAILIAMRMRRCDEGRPMEHILGFTRSHWMPPLGKCLHCIAAAATMVYDFGSKTQNTNKKLFLAS
jgi:hypothetical protein